MASLIEELITTLSNEEELYKALIPVAEKKTQVIVENDLRSLNSITDQEQEFVNEIGKLEKKRQEVIHSIGIVMNKKKEELTFETIIGMLEGQPDEQEALRRLHDRLKMTIDTLRAVNERNQSLIKQSLEMIEFDIRLIRNINAAPETGQYNKTYEVEMKGSGGSVFDTKQ